MTDSELLFDYINKRDEDAFAELVLRYERLVWSVCYCLLVNHSDREDAFQETFLVLGRNAHRIRKPNSLSNWLYGVAWKTASRIRKRRTIMSLNEYIESGNEIAESGETQLDKITRLSEFELVNRNLQSMPEVYRTPLVLFYYSGFTAKQIASQLNLTLAATEGRLRRARERLRKLSYRSIGPDEGRSLSQGSIMLVLAGGINFQSCPDLIALTVENSIAATANVSIGVTSELINSGAKIMICKFACAAGLSAIMALGGAHHLGVIQDDGAPAAVQVVLQQPELEGELTTEFELSEEEAGVGQFRLGTDSGQSDCCALYQAIRSSVGACQCCASEVVHCCVALHARKLCELVGCCSE